MAEIPEAVEFWDGGYTPPDGLPPLVSVQGAAWPRLRTPSAFRDRRQRLAWAQGVMFLSLALALSAPGSVL